MTSTRISDDFPRVIATDLDGTLLRSDGSISARTRAALNRLDASGIDVIFVTARPPRWLPDVLDAVASHGHVICLGGACLAAITPGQFTVLEYHGFQPGTIAEVVADLRTSMPGVMLGAERASGATMDDEYPALGDYGPVLRGGVEASFSLAEPIAKLVVRHSSMSTDEILDSVSAAVGDRAVRADSGAHGLAELMPVGISKSSTLQRWCASRGIGPESVWTFGDMPADLPMLEWSGRSFAVGQSRPDVMAGATDVLPSNDDDSMAELLESLLR